jgi:hypothetical protein
MAGAAEAGELSGVLAGLGVLAGDADRAGVDSGAGLRAAADGDVVRAGIGEAEGCTTAGMLPARAVAGGRTSR